MFSANLYAFQENTESSTSMSFTSKRLYFQYSRIKYAQH